MSRIAQLTTKAREHRMRMAFYDILCEWHARCPDTLLVSEFAVGHGQGYADIVTVNSEISGIELKTSSDSLARLSIQIPYYNSVFSQCTLVCDRKHLAKAKMMLPRWWGLVCADERDGMFCFEEIYIAIRNPTRIIERELHLLWREECVSILNRFDAGHKLKWKSRRVLYARILETVPVTLLRAEIVKAMHARTDWKRTTVRDYAERHHFPPIPNNR